MQLRVAAVPEAAIRSRRAALVSSRMSSKYQQSKCSTWRGFLKFLAARPGNHVSSSCGPSDVVDFLVASDVAGKTRVHSRPCDAEAASLRLRPGSLRPSCVCPRRLAFGTIDSMVGRLRSAFFDDGRSHVDNPAAARVVKQYISDVRSEQLQRGVVPKQATPVFSSKVRHISSHIRCLLDASSLSPVTEPAARYTMLRCRAMLVLDACCLKRGTELGTTLTDSVIRFPDDSGMIFNYTWGKTLRSGSTHVFGVMRNPDDLDLCAVACVDAYVQGALGMGIDLSGPGAFLFRPWRDGHVPNRPLLAAQLNSDFRSWLVRCGIYKGETLHGVRTGAAIEMALKGNSLRAVMDQALWRRRDTARHYLKVWQVMGASVADSSRLPSRSAAAEGSLSAVQYANMNSLVGFFAAFGAPGTPGPRAL